MKRLGFARGRRPVTGALHAAGSGVKLLLATAGAALYVVAFRLGERVGGVPAFDVYGYFYPNILYALRGLATGGGLLWNPDQNCGQPFFAISSVGLLYPPTCPSWFSHRPWRCGRCCL